LRATKRAGIDSTIAWLEQTDFYTAPASTRYHGSVEGGLALHAWNVYGMIRFLNERLPVEKRYQEDTLALVSLLHDVCKVHTYEPKILKSGQQSKAEPYVRAEKLPIGHGEKSLILLIKAGLELTDEEMVAIVYHMNMYHESGWKVKGNFNPLSILLFCSDYLASTFWGEPPQNRK
jgi:HD superfamily phosphohydrolase YqeK